MRLYYFVLLILISALISSCLHTSNDPSAHLQTSSNAAELAQLINLERYAPRKVEWLYIQDKSDLDSAPKTQNLQALMYFDTATTARLKENYKLLSVSLISGEAKEFDFEWLSDSYRKKLYTLDLSCFYNAYFFKKGNLSKGYFALLNDTAVLLSFHTE